MYGKPILVLPEVFKPAELKNYEQRILDSKNVSEREASLFFNEFPKFLTIGGYAEIAREVVLYKGDSLPMYRVDFCRRKFGEKYWDFIELKSPKIPFVVRKCNHWKFSAEVEAGIHQALNYSDFLENDLHRFELEKRTGIKAYRPKVLLIAGRKSSKIESVELRRLISRYNNLDLQTYEDIYQFAIENYKSSLIVVPVMQSWELGASNLTTVEPDDFIRFISGYLVSIPKAIEVQLMEGDNIGVVELKVASEDLKNVLGNQGRTARAMRTLLSEYAGNLNKRLVLEIRE